MCERFYERIGCYINNLKIYHAVLLSNRWSFISILTEYEPTSSPLFLYQDIIDDCSQLIHIYSDEYHMLARNDIQKTDSYILNGISNTISNTISTITLSTLYCNKMNMWIHPKTHRHFTLNDKYIRQLKLSDFTDKKIIDSYGLKSNDDTRTWISNDGINLISNETLKKLYLNAVLSHSCETNKNLFG